MKRDLCRIAGVWKTKHLNTNILVVLSVFIPFVVNNFITDKHSTRNKLIKWFSLVPSVDDERTLYVVRRHVRIFELIWHTPSKYTDACPGLETTR